MKTLLVLSLFALAGSAIQAEEPVPKAGKESTFYQRFFGPNGAQNRTLGAAQSEEKTWPLYPQGKLPAGQTVSLAGVGSLPTGGRAGQITYLAGDFVVTASGDGRAVLRPVDPVEPPIRLIAMYSSGQVVPPEKTKLTLSNAGGWVIQDIRKGADGQLNVYVRAILEP